MNNINNNKLKSMPRQRGFSIIELLVAVGLGLFLMAALVEVLLSGKQSFTAADHISRLQESGRVAINMIATDLKRTGYMGGNSDIDSIQGSELPSTVATNCPSADTTWGRMIQQPLFGLDDTNAGYACITNASYLRGDVLTIRFASPWLAGAFSSNQIYLRTSLFEGKIFKGSDQTSTANVVDDEPKSVHDLLAYSYYVGNSGRSCAGLPVPSLFRIRVGANGQPRSDELLPGIENFQVQYGVNGQYLDANNVTDWTQVTTARIWLLVRSECAENGFTDRRTYNLGDQVFTPNSTNDSFRRQLYSSVVMLRNTN